MTSQLDVGLTQTGEPTRLCDVCRESLNRTHYSMTPGLFDEYASFANKTAHPVCNACQVATRGPYVHRFLAIVEADDTWRKRANCEPKNWPASIKTWAEHDRRMFPAPGQVRNKPWGRMCKGCPVIEECRKANEAMGSCGVWADEWHPNYGEANKL